VHGATEECLPKRQKACKDLFPVRNISRLSADFDGILFVNFLHVLGYAKSPKSSFSHCAVGLVLKRLIEVTRRQQRLWDSEDDLCYPKVVVDAV